MDALRSGFARYLTRKVFRTPGRPADQYRYVPALRFTVQVLRPVPLMLVRWFTLGPTSRKLCLRELSVTTKVYGPAASLVTILPSCRRSTRRPWTVPWSTRPLAMLLGTSCRRFGEREITP